MAGEHHMPKSCAIPWSDLSEPGAVIPWWYWPISYLEQRRRETQAAMRAYEARRQRARIPMIMAAMLGL